MDTTQQSTIRESPYIESPNCSVVQIRENSVFLFTRELYYTDGTDIDYYRGKALFFYKTDKFSLNQDPDAPRAEFKICEVSLNIAFDIFKAFKELDKENERRVQAVMQ